MAILTVVGEIRVHVTSYSARATAGGTAPPKVLRDLDSKQARALPASVAVSPRLLRRTPQTVRLRRFCSSCPRWETQRARVTESRSAQTAGRPSPGASSRSVRQQIPRGASHGSRAGSVAESR